MLETRSGRTASQQPNELAALVDVLVKGGVTSYLEIGARHGDTFDHIVRKLPKVGFYVAVDLPNGLWGSDSSMDALIECVEALQADGYNAHYVLGDSSNEEVIELISSLGEFDAVLIDGDHRYHAVKRDYENYGDARIVAFHDIDGEGVKLREHEIGVPQLWGELRDKHKSVEIIDPSDDRPMGIGVLFK